MKEPSSLPSPSYGKQHKQYVHTSIYVPFVWSPKFVPTLPEYYHLEQTAVFVPTTPLCVVAGRISYVLRERSIEAHYDDEEAKVKCLTAEGVDFRIRLYRGRGVQYNHGIVVEVQRRFGASFIFYEDTKIILAGAQGKVVHPSSKNAINNNLPKANNDDQIFDEISSTDIGLYLPKANNDDQICDDISSTDIGLSFNIVVEDFSEGTSSKNTGSSFDVVSEIMKHPGFDSQYLALQVLSSLVDSEKLPLSTTQTVATKLLQTDNEVSDKVFDYIVNKSNETFTTTTGSYNIDEQEKNNDDLSEEYMVLRNMCLNILSKSLRAIYYIDGNVSSDFRARKQPMLRFALLEDLENAEQHPNTALLSANCMEYLVGHTHHTALVELYSQAFRIALKVGEERHLNLFCQAQKCMVTITGRQEELRRKQRKKHDTTNVEISHHVEPGNNNCTT